MNSFGSAWLAVVHATLLASCEDRGQVGKPSLDIDKYWEENPQPNLVAVFLCLKLFLVAQLPPLAPTWTPPDGESFENFTGRYGMDAVDFDEVKELIRELLESNGVPRAEASNNNGRIDDIVRTPEQLQRLLDHRRNKRSLVLNFGTYTSYKWPRTSTIKYQFSGEHTDVQKALIREAFQFWQDNTCLSFQEVYSDPGEQYLLITAKSDGCYASLGRRPIFYGKPQVFNLASPGCVYGGIIAHEIGHSIGLQHEQSRQDRDSYVSVNFDNIDSDKTSNFQKTDNGLSYGPYDFNSIMHYETKAFAVNSNRDTITPIGESNRLFLKGIGQRVYPTFLDIKGANLAVCGDVCTSSPNCLNGGYADPKDCSKCRCPEGLGGINCENAAPGSAACSPNTPAIIDVPADGTKACITSPGFAATVRHPMGKGELCSFYIKAPIGCTINTNFEFGPDTLMRSQGGCVHWVELKYKQDLSLPGPRFCGNHNPQTITGREYLTTESNTLVASFNAEAPYFRWMSYPKEGIQGYGFKLCYQLTTTPCVDPCQPNPCGIHGTCRPTQDSYRCTCSVGFTGPNCTQSGAAVQTFSPIVILLSTVLGVWTTTSLDS